MLNQIHTFEPYQLASRAITYARMNSPFPLPEGALGDLVLDKLIDEGMPELIERRRGFIYVAVNEDWPDIYKVGCTRRGVEERMASLNSAGMLTPWVAVRSWKVFDATALEAKVHAGLGSLRATKEMFYGPLSRIDLIVERELNKGMQDVLEGIPDYWLPNDFRSEFAVMACIKSSEPVNLSILRPDQSILGRISKLKGGEL